MLNESFMLTDHKAAAGYTSNLTEVAPKSQFVAEHIAEEP